MTCPGCGGSHEDEWYDVTIACLTRALREERERREHLHEAAKWAASVMLAERWEAKTDERGSAYDRIRIALKGVLPSPPLPMTKLQLQEENQRNAAGWEMANERAERAEAEAAALREVLKDCERLCMPGCNMTERIRAVFTRVSGP